VRLQGKAGYGSHCSAESKETSEFLLIYILL
jgi:hypothetical protein